MPHGDLNHLVEGSISAAGIQPDLFTAVRKLFRQFPGMARMGGHQNLHVHARGLGRRQNAGTQHLNRTFRTGHRVDHKYPFQLCPLFP